MPPPHLFLLTQFSATACMGNWVTKKTAGAGNGEGADKNGTIFSPIIEGREKARKNISSDMRGKRERGNSKFLWLEDFYEEEGP